jgi:hypothetical protein
MHWNRVAPVETGATSLVSARAANPQCTGTGLHRLKPVLRRWFNAFQGAHMLLGFNSNMADIAFGGQLVANMRMPSFPIIGDLPWAQLTIAQAWVKTAFDMNAGKPAYIYARSSTVNPINDKLPKPGSAFPSRPTLVTSYHWVWWEF